MQLHVLAFAGPDPSARAWDLASRVTGLTQALAAMGFELPAPDTRGAFEARGRGRMVRSTVARWDSDKRWLLAMETVAALKRQHWHPHLMARGGVEAHGGEVVTAAAGAGVRVVERPLPQPGVPGLLRVLEELHEVDVVSLRSPLDSDSCWVLFRGSAAVLANRGREPFGLVGLETMAVDGVACTGCSGEDSAVPGRNALVLETNDLQEFLRLFGALHTQAQWERALRRTARRMARHDAWPQIMRHLLFPRLDS